MPLTEAASLTVNGRRPHRINTDHRDCDKRLYGTYCPESSHRVVRRSRVEQVKWVIFISLKTKHKNRDGSFRCSLPPPVLPFAKLSRSLQAGENRVISK